MGDQRSSFYEHVHNLISGEQYSSKLITQSKLARIKNLCDGLPCEVTDKTSGPRNTIYVLSTLIDRKITNSNLRQRKIGILLYIF